MNQQKQISLKNTTTAIISQKTNCNEQNKDIIKKHSSNRDKVQNCENQNQKNNKSKQSSSKLILLKQQQRTISNQNKNIKIDITKSEYPLLRNIIQNDFGWKLWDKKNQKDDANLIWVDTYVTQQSVRRLKPYQKVNHFPSSQELGKKDLLSRNINQMIKIFPKDYNFYPKTWILPEQNQQFRKFQLLNPDKYYIVKPPASSQGRGIYLSKKVQLLGDQKQTRQYKQYKQWRLSTPIGAGIGITGIPANIVGIKRVQESIVQQYIQKPLLIDNLKFDCRIYVLIKSISPLKIFVYNEGLTRLATKQYIQPSEDNQQCLNMHLTNYAINKITPLFIQNKNVHEDNFGHKRSLSALLKILKQKGCQIEKLQEQIDGIIIKTVISAYTKLNDAYRAVRDVKQQKQSVCFEIMGFDILITQDFTPKLIQVNHSPSFSTDSPLDYIIKKYLLLDTLNLVNVDHQGKIDFIKKRSLENTNKNWFRSQQFKQFKEIKTNKHLQQLFQSLHLGGFRKIFPFDKNYSIKEHPRMQSLLNVFNKVNEQYIVKRVKQKFKPQIVDVAKYRKRGRERNSYDCHQLYNQYQTLEVEMFNPPILASETYKDMNFRNFNFTYYQFMKKSNIQEDFLGQNQYQSQKQENKIDPQLKRLISPAKQQRQKQRPKYKSKQQRQKQKQKQLRKKYQVPVKMKNISIDFFDEQKKRPLNEISEMMDQPKTFAAKYYEKESRVFSMTPPIKNFEIQQNNQHKIYNKNDLISKVRQKQICFDNELKQRINRMKMARVRLHKIKKIERSFVDNCFKVELQNLKI